MINQKTGSVLNGNVISRVLVIKVHAATESILGEMTSSTKTLGDVVVLLEFHEPVCANSQRMLRDTSPSFNDYIMDLLFTKKRTRNTWEG